MRLSELLKEEWDQQKKGAQKQKEVRAKSALTKPKESVQEAPSQPPPMPPQAPFEWMTL